MFGEISISGPYFRGRGGEGRGGEGRGGGLNTRRSLALQSGFNLTMKTV